LPAHIDAQFNFNFGWKIDRGRAYKDDLIFTSFLRGIYDSHSWMRIIRGMPIS